MSTQEAINLLNEALRMADLPNPSQRTAAYEKDGSGEVVAADMAFRVGYMKGTIKNALDELGAPAKQARTPNDCPKCGSSTCYCEIAHND